MVDVAFTQPIFLERELSLIFFLGGILISQNFSFLHSFRRPRDQILLGRKCRSGRCICRNYTCDTLVFGTVPRFTGAETTSWR